MYALKHAWLHYAIDIVKEVQQNLKFAQHQQKCYADLKKNSKRVQHWWSCIPKGKSQKRVLRVWEDVPSWHPSMVDLSEVLVKIGSVSYQLVIPPNIEVHDVLHVSLEKIYTWCYSYNWMKCNPGRTPGQIPERNILHPWQEGMYATESSHRSNKNEMGALHP